MTIQRDAMEGKSFKDMTDDELVILAKEGDEDAFNILFKRYTRLVGLKASRYFAPGIDREDLKQEGNIGLYNSIRDYKLEHPTSFRVFAELCINRQIITAVKTATRQKHKILNQYTSIDKPMYDDDSDRTLHDTIENPKQFTPEDILIDYENIYEITAKLKDRLSPLEAGVLELHLYRMSYQEISEELGKHVKSVDNAMQRIRIKLGKIFFEIHGYEWHIKKGDEE